MVVAIDGPSGVGKSTVGKAVAEALGVGYLDTGSYYRAATLAVLDAGTPIGQPHEVEQVVRDASLDFVDGAMHLDGRDVSTEIRDEHVTSAVSAVSAIPEVRAIVVDRQRQWVERAGGDAVVEGRDIGTVVFPDAEVKVFLTADPYVRAQRRHGDAETEGRDLEEVAAALEARDIADSTREVSPLVPAEDAVIIDTSAFSSEEVVALVLGLVDPA